MKRVLFTGANGFIGSPCLNYLTDLNYEIHGVSTSSNSELIPNVTWHKCDLLNSFDVAALCKKVKATHLLHLAWDVKPGYKTSVDNLDWVKASMGLLRAFYENGGRRAAFAGTCFEYDLHNGVLRENLTPMGPHTVYGAAKHTLHELVRDFAKKTDLSYAWSRVFYLYGPNELPERLVASVIKSILSGQIAACSEGRQVLDFLHVFDVASALVTILDSDIQGGVNVGSGVPTSVRELVLTIAEILGNKKAVNLGAFPSPQHEPPVIIANIEKLSQLGWQPKFSLDKGLLDTCNWWRETLQQKAD